MEDYTLALAAYEAYGEQVNWKNFRGDPMPQFQELPPETRTAWKAAADAVLPAWLDGRFKSAVQDDDNVLRSAALLKVGQQSHDSSVEAVRRCISHFVVEMISPDVMES